MRDLIQLAQCTNQQVAKIIHYTGHMGWEIQKFVADTKGRSVSADVRIIIQYSVKIQTVRV
jgi:hypothetical protein